MIARIAWGRAFRRTGSLALPFIPCEDRSFHGAAVHSHGRFYSLEGVQVRQIAKA